jgi:uncharacterized protein (TIGR03086 family)
MDLNTLYHRTVESWADRVNAIKDDQWDGPTPCQQWSVRDLVNHVTYENLWTVPLMEGATIAEVGDRFEGDQLGDDPVGAALSAARAAITSVAASLPRGGTVELSFGETPKSEYVYQLATDNLVHGWDLAAATGGDTRLDPNLVGGIAAWFAEREDMYRDGGAIAARAALDGDAQHDLLAKFGRDGRWGRNHAVLARFGAAFAGRELDAVMELVTDDIVFESTSPAPDGDRVEGKDAVRAAWAEVFATPGMELTEEESFVGGDRAVVRWRYAWGGSGSEAGHVRGVDVIRFRDGLLCEKFSYVKG